MSEPPEDGTEDPDDLLDSPEWNPPRRVNRLTVVLAATLLTAGGFLGGVFVQDAFGNTGGPAARGGTGGGPVRVGPGSSGNPAAAPTRAQAAPVVVGTVASMSDTTITVTDLAGTARTVNVPPTATVTTSGLGGLSIGAPVSVTGTRGGDGVVTADSITSRPPGG